MHIFPHLHVAYKTTNKKLPLQNVHNTYAEFVCNIPTDGYNFLWMLEDFFVFAFIVQTL